MEKERTNIEKMWRNDLIGIAIIVLVVIGLLVYDIICGGCLWCRRIEMEIDATPFLVMIGIMTVLGLIIEIPKMINRFKKKRQKRKEESTE